MTDRSVGRTLWNLCLALLNATLILVAICRFLGWRLASTVEGISETFANTILQARPIRDDFQALQLEVSGLREDVADLKAAPGTPVTASLVGLNSKLSRIDENLSGISEKIAGAFDDPDALVETAIRTAAGELAGFVTGSRQCRPVEETPAQSG